MKYPVEKTSLEADHGSLLAAAERLGPLDTVIIDRLKTTKKLNIFLKRKARFLTVIDDDGGPAAAADLVISPGLFRSSRRPVKNKDYFHGKKFILLRRSFLTAASLSKNSRQTSKDALICFGGTDPNNLAEKVCDILSSQKTHFKGRFIVVLGERKNFLSRMIRRYPRDIFSFRGTVSNMASLLRSSRFSIISGGTLLYESCAMSCPAIVISQNKAQEKEARIFAGRKAAVNLGCFSPAVRERLGQAMNRIVTDAAYARRLGQRAKKKVDGLGCVRVAGVILKRMELIGAKLK